MRLQVYHRDKASLVDTLSLTEICEATFTIITSQRHGVRLWKPSILKISSVPYAAQRDPVIDQGEKPSESHRQEGIALQFPRNT